jgi:peptide/nickel transport system permease protein
VRTYILKRLILMLPTLVGITLLTYLIVRLAPGDPIEAMIRAQAGDINPQVFAKEADAMRSRLGLKDYNLWGTDPDRIDPLEKLLNAFAGYGRWMANMARGDFGESIKFTASDGTKRPISLFLDRMPVTLTLNVIADVAVFVIAVPVGLVSARRRGGLFDRLATIILLALWSIPVILAGPVMKWYLGRGGAGWAIFPVAGLHAPDAEALGWAAYIGDTLWHAVLPVVCLVYGGLAYLAKLGRTSLLENLRADYVRTARAKGLSEDRVVYHHALRNSLLPMITIMVLMLPGLLGGSVIVETIFSIEGMGRLLVEAARAYDLSVVMFDLLVYAALTLGFLLIADILYAWADPRVRYE